MAGVEWVRRINYLGHAVGGGEHLVTLDWEALKEIAQRTTGLDDFGNDEYDPYYSAIDRHSRSMSVLQRLIARKTILLGLRNRLLLTQKLKENPAIVDERVDEPVVVTGLQRTGTSILFELLAQDIRYRAPTGFEIQFPAGLPESASQGTDPRELAESEFEFMTDVCPKLKSMHEFRHDLPIDCSWIMKSVMSMSTQGAYQWHKRILQALQYGRSRKPWLLKCVSHLGNLNKLFDCYPGARVIVTHRDPVNSIASGIHILREAAPFLFIRPDVSTNEYSLEYMNTQEAVWRKVIEQRCDATIPERQIADIHFSKLLTDPVAAVRNAYEKLGIAFNDELAGKIAEYLRNKPRHKFGRNEYSAVDFGLTDDEIRNRFAFYVNHFHIERDGDMPGRRDGVTLIGSQP